MSDADVKPGHGDHWLAALEQDDPRLRDVLAPPVDVPGGLHLRRSALSEALDMVQVTRERRLVTAYPEPRATTLLRGTPRDLTLWETRVEGWLTLEHDVLGALTVFVTDLVENARRYVAAGTRSGLALEVGGVVYLVARAPPHAQGPDRLSRATRTDARFLADDYAFDAEVVAVHEAGAGEVLDLRVQGGVVLPVAWRARSLLEPGDRAQGYAWLTGRLPRDVPGEKG